MIFVREAHYIKSYWDKNMNEWRDEFLYAMLKENWKRAVKKRHSLSSDIWLTH